MDQQHARWISPAGFLLLNVIGWGVFYFVISSTVLRQPEKAVPDAAVRDALARAVDGRLESLETHMRKLTEQVESVARLAQARPPDEVGRRLSQAELRRLESTTARLEDELGNLSRRTHVTVDLNALIQGLRPNVSFGLLRITPTKPGVLELTFQMRNLGAYAVTVDAPVIALAPRPFAESGPNEGVLVPGQDYAVRADRVETLLPNESKNFAYAVTLNDPRRLANPLYYRATFRTSTDPAVVATSTGLLKGKLPEKDIRDLSVAQYGHVGEVTAGLQRP
ncbi:MAG: hypothetical protein ACREVS_03665 [Burkholderiales bacterium]